MALCDPNSGFVRGPCIPDSDENTPTMQGSAFLEMQFYPPGNPPFITQISCDLTHWCASLHINSLENMDNGMLNPNCTETTNFAFIQRNGIPTGPPGPNNLTVASFTPNAQTLLMNQGDVLRVTVKDAPGDVFGGVLTLIEDLTTGQSGFMIASAHNGYQTTDPNTCAGTNFSFHPEFDTAKFGNFVSWAALQANVNFCDGNRALRTRRRRFRRPACFPGPTVAGCLGEDVDFDGTSYLTDWPDGTRNHATSVAISSVAGNGIGPLSLSDDTRRYDQPFPIVQFETDVSASEQACQPNGVGCVVPPAGAQFYPFYAVAQSGAAMDTAATTAITATTATTATMAMTGTPARWSSAISVAPASTTLAAMRNMVRRTCIGSSARIPAARGAIRASRRLTARMKTSNLQN